MIKCDICGKAINDPKDVNVLALFNLVPRTFCNKCYAEKERGITRHLFYAPKQPINGKLFIIGLSIFTVIGLFLLLALTFNFGETNQSIGNTGRIFFMVFVLLVIGWEWILWFIARGRVNAAIKR